MVFWQGAELDRERRKRQRERSNNLKEGKRDMKVIKRQSDALQEVIHQRDALAEELAITKNEDYNVWFNDSDEETVDEETVEG